jgi:hypothetical protein
MPTNPQNKCTLQWTNKLKTKTKLTIN